MVVTLGTLALGVAPCAAARVAPLEYPTSAYACVPSQEAPTTFVPVFSHVLKEAPGMKATLDASYGMSFGSRPVGSMVKGTFVPNTLVPDGILYFAS
jgi:hypothetical protein